MDALERMQENVDELILEVEKTNITVKRIDEIEKVVDSAIEQFDRYKAVLIQNIRIERSILRRKAEHVYTLLSNLTERFNQIPKMFRPGLFKHLWHLGIKKTLFKNPLIMLEKLIQFSTKYPDFNVEQYRDYLDEGIDACNSFGKLLEQAERKLITYTGERGTDWPIIGKTFKEELYEELEFYEEVEVLRPCTSLTDQWLALVNHRNKY